MRQTHEPIIEQRDYDMVHKMIQHRWKQMDCSKNINYFAGLLFCGDCGRAMTKSKRKDGIDIALYDVMHESVCSIVHSI